MIALLLLALLQAAPEVSVEARPGKTEVGVGERFPVEVVAKGPAGTTWTFPAEISDERVELRAPSPSPSATPPAPGTQVYEAAVFTLEEPKLPEIEVKYRLPDGTEGAVRSAAVPLKIVSALPKDPKEQQLADVRPPLSLGIGRAFWVATGVLALLLALLVIWLWRRRRGKAAPAVVVPEVAPDAEALQALEQLERSGHLMRGDWRGFYIELTAVAKRYLERRLGAPVLEMTSSEMLALLREHRHGADALPALRDLAGAADAVKFARGAGLVDEAQRHLAGVRSLVAALEARLRAEAAAVAAASARKPA